MHRRGKRPRNRALDEYVVAFGVCDHMQKLLDAILRVPEEANSWLPGMISIPPKL